MLTESFVVSLLTPSAHPASSTLKDVGVCIHEFQPSPSLRTGLKKSSTESNSLAVSPSHIFAAQAGKAVVHVYSREKGNQEATVAFPERIRSLALAVDDGGIGVLILGTEGGRLILWEICSGRQIPTSASHLQSITSLVVDPTCNFILSGSEDGNVHVWSLPNLLSFSRPSPAGHDQLSSNSPLRTFTNHRAPIACLAVGHSSNRSNIAISTSRDKKAFVWEYRTGKLLRTFLLPESPLCLAVDPADRAFYVGYDDGSVQIADFFRTPSIHNPLYDYRLQSTPTQLFSNERWLPPSPEFGAAACLTLSYDGMTLLSGHKNGSVVCWDVARARYASTITNYNSPVTNLQMLPADSQHQERSSRIIVHNVVKPRYDHALSNASQHADAVPAHYTINAHLKSPLPVNGISQGQSGRGMWNVDFGISSPLPDEFSAALTHPFFPSALISEGLSELLALRREPIHSESSMQESEKSSDQPQIQSLEEEVASLKKQVSIQESARQADKAEILKLREYVATLEDYSNELHDKQERAQQAKLERRARKEERALRRREAWFEAEKKGQSGDAVVQKMEIEDGEETSETNEMSSDDDM